jgi:hypothetical protein
MKKRQRKSGLDNDYAPPMGIVALKIVNSSFLPLNACNLPLGVSDTSEGLHN